MISGPPLDVSVITPNVAAMTVAAANTARRWRRWSRSEATRKHLDHHIPSAGLHRNENRGFRWSESPVPCELPSCQWNGCPMVEVPEAYRRSRLPRKNSMIRSRSCRLNASRSCS